MTPQHATSWLMIARAAAGSDPERAEFAHRYSPVIRAYLGERWRHSTLKCELDDAVQEVFVECFRHGGALERVEADRPGGFRAFLYGVVRNVARRFEERAGRRQDRQCPSDVLGRLPDDEPSLSTAFDRAYARSLLREAFDLLAETASHDNDGLQRRVELLRLRFRDGQPIREIARQWNTDAKRLHRELDRAKREFRSILLELIAGHCPGLTDAELRQRCNDILLLCG